MTSIIADQLLFVTLCCLYSCLFLIDTGISNYHLLKAIQGGLKFSTYVERQKLTFLVRILNVLMMPVVGIILDTNAFDANIEYKFLILMVIPSLSMSVAGYLFLRKYIIIKVYFQRKRLLIYSMSYGFQYLAVPIALLVGSLFPEYRASIVASSVALNFIANVGFVYLVDSRVSKLLDIETDKETLKEVFTAIFMGRLLSKLGIFLLYYISFYFVI